MSDDIEIAKLQERVAMLERQVQFLLGQAPATYVDMPAAVSYPDVADLKHRGKLIDAIKLYRTYTGSTLEAAKAYVENL